MKKTQETYKHYYAKQLLLSWLKDAEAKDSYCTFAQFSWRKNYGVFEDLPFYESSDAYYFEASDGLIDILAENLHNAPVDPTTWFDPDYDRGKLLFTPDITIFHKGTPKYLFVIETVVSPSEERLRAIEEFFQGDVPEVFGISADTILHQTGVPEDHLFAVQYTNLSID